MSKNLVLVESPSKAKTINKYLGKSYHVEATVGHIKNLPKSKLGVDIENGFAPSLLNIRGKGDIIKKIKSYAAKSKEIYIATDPDREGESIAQDIVEVISGHTDAKVHRVLFNEITKNAVEKAMKAPLVIDVHLVSSQRARRVMDRIIGYQISPFLWRAVISGSDSSLSAGRVQSVALRLICEREEEILSFIPIEYWSIWGFFTNSDGKDLKAKLQSIDGKGIKVKPSANMTEEEIKDFEEKNILLNTVEKAEAIFNEIQSRTDYKISDMATRESKRNPFPPFITSSLQVESSRKLRYRPRKTMMLAQNLYEGIEIGTEGLTGLITYMRTDSTRISEEILVDARELIKQNFGAEYLPPQARVYDKKKKNVQDAHEAIRPTSMAHTPDFVKPYLTADQFKLYELIWKRFIASQMESAILENTSVEIESGRFVFRATGTAIKFDGFLKVYDEDTEDVSDANGNGSNIPYGLKNNEEMSLASLEKNQHFTKPPARYTESTLIKELEAKNVGRPSTYALIMGTIQDRNYVELQERKLYPTKLGIQVNTILVKNFPTIIDVNFTAQMEDELDGIADGEIEYIKVLNDFYTPFSKVLAEVEKNIEKIKCDKCGSDMDIKIGRFGKFLACTNYPECKNIKSLKDVAQEEREVEYTGEDCPKCGSKTLVRESKFGKFVGCEKYPDCDFTKDLTLGISCPKCSTGDVVIRRTKKARIFYGCNKYPDCDFASWKRPVPPIDEENDV
ncbi:MAG: type I DNA topoisomerase [Flavobacterium sp.]|nr:type I DNA topoisomerase [Flavobacterium sp.]